MDWLNKNYEKLIVALVAAITLFFGVNHILKATSYTKAFERTSARPKKDFPSIPVDVMKNSQAILAGDFSWDLTVMPMEKGKRKILPLLTSVPIVALNGRQFNLSNPDEDPIRPPVSNAWLLEHRSPYLNSTILEDDSDTDGYSNLEEWNANPQTVPVDAASHPPYTDKLVFVERKQRSFYLIYAAANKPKFQLNIRPYNLQPKVIYVEVGETFADGRFTVLGHEDREGLNDSGIKTDVSQLEIKDNTTGRSFKIERRKEENWPEYFAHLNFTLDPSQNTIYVKEGETFELSKEPGKRYRLTEVTDEKAVIEVGPGKTISLAKGAAPAPAATAQTGSF